MKEKINLFCFGFGQVAKYFVKNLIKKKINFNLFTTNTKETYFKEFYNIKYKSYFFLNNKFDPKLLDALNSSNKVLISIPPKNKVDRVLKLFKKNFEENKFDWVTYLSATSVYGDKKGEWVNEKSKTEPTSERGTARLNAENKWLSLSKNFNLPLQIFRLTGIYSIENNVIERLKTKKIKIVNKKKQFFSRIHIEDIAEILTISLKKFISGEIYNISDNYPCSNEEVIEYAANLIKINLPKKVNLENLKSEMSKNFYKDSKKVDNKKMKEFFDYKLKYPNFKRGLRDIHNHLI